MALALAGCSPDPLQIADQNATTEGRSFASPPASMAAIYVVQTYGPNIDVTLDAGLLGTLREDHWLRTDTRAGRHELRCRLVALRDTGDALSIDIAAGQTIFVSVAYAPLRSPSCRLTLSSQAAAQPAILAGKRVRELR